LNIPGFDYSTGSFWTQNFTDSGGGYASAAASTREGLAGRARTHQWVGSASKAITKPSTRFGQRARQWYGGMELALF